MKKIGIAIISLLLMSGLMAQDCEKTFESNYLKLSICNDQNWEIEQTLPYIKIKTPEVATFITIFSEPYEGTETSKELVVKSFKSDKDTYPTIEKTNEEDIELDGVSGTLYTAKVPNKQNQTTTFIIVHNGRKITINNNCYSNCENAEQAVKSAINKVKVQKIEEPKLTEKELMDFEKFKLELHSAFQSGKVKSFEKLLVNQSLMLELIETKLKDETMKQRFSTIIKTNWEEFSKEFVGESKESYDKLLAKGKVLGIDWKRIELIEVVYKLESTIPGITSARCEYNFSSQGKEYQITIDSVEPLKSGWYISKLDTSYIKEI
jgi:hypothetical protein